LLGGSSNARNAKARPSKLASLAKSTRGAFEKKEIQQKAPSSSLGSVARLSSLSSNARPKNDSASLPPAQTPLQEPSSTVVTDGSGHVDHHPRSVEPSTDPRADDLLAQPSTLAKSLCHISVIPHSSARLLLKIHANTSLLTAGSEGQLKNAFAAPSPDDIVQNAQRRVKGFVTDDLKLRV
jgi:hypothetical protein